jgi:hypothetical protein
MATGSVSAIDQDTWQLIQTNTTTSGTTSTFSGLTGYKEYIIAWENVSQDTNGQAFLQFNSDTGNNYFGGIILLEAGDAKRNKRDRIKLSWDDFRTTVNGYLSIKNVNNGAPKFVDGLFLDSTENNWNVVVRGGWTSISPITSIVITAGGSGTFTAGSMKLYGIAG